MPLQALLPLPLTLYGRACAVLDNPDALGVLISQLKTRGFRIQSIEMLTDPADVARLDQDGARHGLLGRLIRAMQGLTDERDLLDEYAWMLQTRHLVIILPLPERTGVLELAKEAFALAHAHHVNYYGRFVNTQLL